MWVSVSYRVLDYVKSRYSSDGELYLPAALKEVGTSTSKKLCGRKLVTSIIGRREVT